MKIRIERLARRLFFRGLRNLQGGYLEVVCPDETYAFGDPSSSLRAMAVVHDERFFVRAVTGADVGIGESFMDRDWTSPDLVALVRVAVRNLRLLDSSHPAWTSLRAMMGRMRHRLRSNSPRGSRRNIRHHYDLGNDFYKLFLDERMNYSSAIWARPGDTLETAQLQKLDLICHKLNLQPGDQVLEIGCGWGAFALHAAQHYGARVTALTLSEAQYRFATGLAAEAKLAHGSVEFLLQDYRKISGKFDKVVSIEMFEAVGFDHYDEFFSTCDRLLNRDGTLLLQLITLPDQEVRAYRKRVDWIQTYIFPGSELASVAEIHRALTRSTRMFLVHMENFGWHYARTLARWRERFLEKIEAVERLGFDPRFQRMWDFYLAWCQGAFLERYINVAQMLLSKIASQQPLAGDPLPEQNPMVPRASA